MTAQAPLMAPFVWSSGGEAVSPDEQKRRRMMAEALIAKGIDTSPVQHWTQGAARVAQALAGNIRLGQIDAEDAAARKAADSDFAALTGGGSAASQQAPANVKLPAPPAPWASGDGGSKTFGEIAPRLTSDLQKEFGLAPHQAAGIVGNLAHESAGFGTMQEISPLVPGSRGGFGYAQWTGPRRVAFENWAQQNGLDPKSYEANYGFLKHELMNTPEGKVLDGLRAAPDAQAATRLFSDRFLRPGIPGMDSRMKWTERAMSFAGAPQASQLGAAQPGDAAQAQPLANMPNAPVRMAALGMNDATSPAQQMGLRPPIVQDAAAMAQPDPGQVIPPQAAQPAPEPRMQVAQAMMAQPQAQAGSDKMQAIMKVMNNPNSSPGAKAVAQAMLQRQLSQESPQYGFQTVGNQVFRTNPKTGTLEPVMTVPKDPLEVEGKQLANAKARKELEDKADFREVRKDNYGNPVYGFVDARTKQVVEYTPPSAGKPATITDVNGNPVPVPDGMDPKVFRETLSKRAAENAAGPKGDDVSALRKEIQQIPSYKNVSQAAPIYKSMVDAASRDSKASDLNLVYGLGKIMDPGSVVREGEMVMVNNTAGIPQWLQGAINSVNGGARLTPETRKQIMAEAHGRMQSYADIFNQDAEFYRGIVTRNRMNEADVIPNFGQFQPWQPPNAAPSGVTGNSGASKISPPAPAAEKDGWTVLDGGVRIREKR